MIDLIRVSVSLTRRFKRYIPAGHRGSSLPFVLTTTTSLFHLSVFYSSAASVCTLYSSTVQPRPRRSRDLLGILFVICIAIYLPALQHYILSFFPHQPPPPPSKGTTSYFNSTHSLRHVSEKPSFPYPNRPPQSAAYPPHSEAGHRAHGLLPRPSDEQHHSRRRGHIACVVLCRSRASYSSSYSAQGQL